MVAGGKSNRGRTGEDYRGGAEGARAIGETKMQLYPDDLWKRDPTRHPSFPIPDQRDVPLWRYLSGTRFRWLVENQRLYMPRIEQLTSNDAREATMPDAQAEFWKELIEKSETPQRREQNQNNFNRLLEYVDWPAPGLDDTQLNKSGLPLE